ncbi:MAG: ABC transporter substrate-binding protein [Rectinema sp.]|nr:ABC transporter substrate-binding protein [Rectinema sp.]
MSVAKIAVIRGPSGIASAWMMSDPIVGFGVRFEFLPVAGADMVVAKLMNGEIYAGVLPVNVAAKLFNSGAPIRALAVVGNGMVKFLTSDPSIRTPGDLKGKIVHIAGQKATPDYLFQYLCKAVGLVAGRDFHAVYSLAYPEIAAGIAAGKLQNAVLPEPFATQALIQNPALLNPFDLRKEWKANTGMDDYPMSLLVARKQLLDEYPAAARLFLDRYRASIVKTIENPAATGKLAETLDLGVKAPVATAAIPVSNFTYIEATAARKEIEALLSVFLEFEPASIGGTLPSDSFYARIP